MHHLERSQLAAKALAGARFTTRSGWARANCPFCLAKTGKDDRKQAFAVHATNGWYKCWKCGEKGQIAGMEEATPEDDWADIEHPAMLPPEEFMELCREPALSALSADPAREYLLGRGLKEDVWEAARVGICLTGKYANRVVVPVLSPTGAWLGHVARSWVDGGPRPYLNAAGMQLGGLLYHHEAVLEPSEEPVLVVEGAFDALSLWPAAAAVLGMPKEEQVASLVAAPRPVCVVLDGDAWGIAQMLSMRLRLEGQRAGFVRLPPCKDPDEMPRDWLLEEARRSLDA